MHRATRSGVCMKQETENTVNRATQDEIRLALTKLYNYIYSVELPWQPASDVPPSHTHTPCPIKCYSKILSNRLQLPGPCRDNNHFFSSELLPQNHTNLLRCRSMQPISSKGLPAVTPQFN